MAAAAESASFEEEHVPNKKPRKECLLKGISNVPDSESEESEFYDVSRNKSDGSDPPADWAHVHPDLEDLDGEVSSMLEAVTFAELQTASVSEVEDWDKELEDFECSPYVLYFSSLTSVPCSCHNTRGVSIGQSSLFQASVWLPFFVLLNRGTGDW
nr:coordinator of PRMT5 and differentiation stimulator isoform X2 [Columba livia]